MKFSMKSYQRLLIYIISSNKKKTIYYSNNYKSSLNNSSSSYNNKKRRRIRKMKKDKNNKRRKLFRKSRKFLSLIGKENLSIKLNLKQIIIMKTHCLLLNLLAKWILIQIGKKIFKKNNHESLIFSLSFIIKNIN